MQLKIRIEIRIVACAGQGPLVYTINVTTFLFCSFIVSVLLSFLFCVPHCAQIRLHAQYCYDGYKVIMLTRLFSSYLTHFFSSFLNNKLVALHT